MALPQNGATGRNVNSPPRFVANGFRGHSSELDAAHLDGLRGDLRNDGLRDGIREGVAGGFGSPSTVLSRIPMTKRPERVLFFGKSMSRSRATGGLVDAWRKHGVETRWLNLSTLRRWLGRANALRWARRTYEKFAPDLVFVFCRDLPQVLLEEFRELTPIVLWVEQPMETHDVSMAHYMTLADLVVLSNPARSGWLEEKGVRNILFQMDGFSPKYHFPIPPRSPKRDVVFVGGPGPNGRRATFLAGIAEHFDLEVFGVGWDEWRDRYPRLQIRGPVKAPGFRKLCATSSIVLGLNQINDDPLYFSNRTFLTLACRGFHLTHYVPRLETVFRDGEQLAWYLDLDDCLERIDQYLADPQERARIAENGYRIALERHQFSHRIERILDVLTHGMPTIQEPTSSLRPVGIVESP